MMTKTRAHDARPPFTAAALAAALLAMSSCGQSEPEYAKDRRGRTVTTEQPAAETPTSPAEEVTPAPSQAEPPAPPTPTPTPTNVPSSAPVAVDDDRIPDHVRERPLVENTGTRSSLGRTRDSARGLRNALQGGLETPPLAITNFEDEYVQIGNVHWDLPDGWQIAIPQSEGILEQIVVPSQTYGAGLIFFTRSEPGSDSVLKDWAGRFLDGTGSPAPTISSPYDVGDYAGRVLTLRGTYVADGRDHPFFMLGFVDLELADGTVVNVAYVASEDTQLENRAKWEEFLDSGKIK